MAQGNGGVIGPNNTITPVEQQDAVTHTKTGSATITTAALTTSVNALLVAGGGGGGAAGAGGGGGGGYLCTTISVSGSFDKQRELELLFINQQTGSDSISTFSDLEIT